MKKIFLLAVSISSFIYCEGLSGVSYFQYSEDAFSLSRTYLTYKSSISDELSFKFQTDVGRVGEDYRFTAFLKKAQLDWSVSDCMKISMGLIGMNMFNVQEKTWGNRFIAKSAMDANNFSSSADLGFSITKDFKMVTANLTMTNGEGYKNMDVDENSKISLQLLHGEKRLDKNNGYNVGLVHSKVKSDKILAIDNDDEIPGTNTSVTGLFGGWAYDNYLRMGAEYNTKTIDTEGVSSDLNAVLTSLYFNYDLNSKVSTFIRLDDYDPNDDSVSTMDEKNTMMFGFVWSPTKGLTICPNITKTTEWISDKEKSNSEFAMNFQFKF